MGEFLTDITALLCHLNSKKNLFLLGETVCSQGKLKTMVHAHLIRGRQSTKEKKKKTEKTDNAQSKL